MLVDLESSILAIMLAVAYSSIGGGLTIPGKPCLFENESSMSTSSRFVFACYSLTCLKIYLSCILDYLLLVAFD